MEKIECVKCGKDIELDVSKALDENGEIYVCPHCGQKFMC